MGSLLLWPQSVRRAGHLLTATQVVIALAHVAQTVCDPHSGAIVGVSGKKKKGKCPLAQFQTVYRGSCIHRHSLIFSRTLTVGEWRSSHSKHHQRLSRWVSPLQPHSGASEDMYEIVAKDNVWKWVATLYSILLRPGCKVIIFLTGDSLCHGEATQAHTLLCYSFSGISSMAALQSLSNPPEPAPTKLWAYKWACVIQILDCLYIKRYFYINK